MKVNRDLANEREAATFNTDDITRHLYDNMQARRLAHKRAIEDPEFAVTDRLNTIDRDCVYNESVRMYTHIMKKCTEYGYSDQGTEWYDYAAAAMPNSHPFNLHRGAFIKPITSQGTPEQIAKFVPLAEAHILIGTYAQTELGHGSFVRGLETTATYDKKTEEFVMHSPTVTSIKYWPGGLGKTSNSAVVMAQLIVDGKNYGMHAFVCLLRDVDTHQPMPGVELGDIGMKLGFQAIDNGYLKFTHYRIPRDNMLMRYSQVSKDGVFSRKSMPQIVYLGMTYIRVAIPTDIAWCLARSATIATRYSAVRRQTANSKGIEPQVLDYQTQQMKLFPAIASAYCYTFLSKTIRQIYNQIESEVSGGDVSRLAEIHCLSSALKAYLGDQATVMIETCRRACGGHGYSHASGIAKIATTMAPAVTYEGENTILYLQTARSLMKFLSMAKSGQTLPRTLQFLCESDNMPSQIVSAEKFKVAEYLILYKLNAYRMVVGVAGKLLQKGGGDRETLWNKNTVELVEAAKAYALYLTAMLFTDKLMSTTWERKAGAVMSQVCEFYLVNCIIENSGSFLQNQVITAHQLNILLSRRIELLADIRPNAVALVDAFDFPDRLLNSCLGRYDGQVYDALYDYAKSSSLNQYQVHPSYQKYVKPMQDSLKAKL